MSDDGARSRAERRIAGWDEDLLPAVTDSPEATRELAGRIARTLRPPAVLALSGELGSGKTQFVKGFCAALGLDPARVTSPTFTLVNEYRRTTGTRPSGGAGAEGSPPVVHVDAYRLEGEEELAPLGIDDHLYGEGYCLIEWADRVQGLLPDHAIFLRFEHVDEHVRRIRLAGERSQPRYRSGSSFTSISE